MNIIPSLLTKVGTYLSFEDRVHARLVSKEWNHSFRESSCWLLQEFSQMPLFREALKEREVVQESPEQRCERTIAAVNAVLKREKDFLTDEELEIENLSYTQRARLGEELERKRAQILEVFFEKLARLVPMAQEFLATLPEAEKIRQWIYTHRRQLNEELHQDLTPEERERFREDRLETRMEALLWGMEEFPQELLFLELDEETCCALYHILSDSRQDRLVFEELKAQKFLEDPPYVSFLIAFMNAARRGFLGFVKAFLSTKRLQKRSPFETYFRAPLTGAAREGRTGVFRELVTSMCFQGVATRQYCLFMALELAMGLGHVEIVDLLLQEANQQMIIPRLPDLIDRATAGGRPEIAEVLRAHLPLRTQPRDDEERSERASKMARRLDFS